MHLDSSETELQNSKFEDTNGNFDSHIMKLSSKVKFKNCNVSILKVQRQR